LLIKLKLIKKILKNCQFNRSNIMKISLLKKKFKENFTQSKEQLFNQFKFLLRNTNNFTERKL